MFNKDKVRIEVVDFEKEAKRRERKQKFEDTVNKAKQKAVEFGYVLYDNRQIIVPVVTIGIPAVVGVSKQIGKWHDRRVERLRVSRQFYDRSLGKYWTTDKKLSTRQLAEIARRKADGEKYVNIFESMGIKFH